MLTIFTTPKPFQGHIGTIQRNAVESWRRIHQDVEIILFGDEPGAQEIARELNLRHVPGCTKNEAGMKLIRGFFAPAQEIARYDLICYINCDIMLTPKFASAAERVSRQFKRFLMVGQRWDVDITAPWPFDETNWEQELQALVTRQGSQVGPLSIDYFLFTRGLYRDIPDLVIGRIWWDHWLIWRARSLGVPVVDATPLVRAVHQNHDYSYHPVGAKGVWLDEQAKRNYKLAGGKSHLYTLEDATHRLTPTVIERNLLYPVAPLRRALRPVVTPVWHKFLDLTRPVRHVAGIRRRA